MDTDLARALARTVAWGRMAIGCTALAAPAALARPWVGEAADTPAGRLLGRAMGGRDLALGVGAVRALHRSDPEARPWVALGGVADAVDAVATVAAFARLPRRARWGVLALTVGAAVVSTRAAIALDVPAPDGRGGAVAPEPPATT